MKQIILIFLIAFLFSCKKEVEYKYVVTGTSGDYDVTYSNSNEGTEQMSNVGSGWSYKWTSSDLDRFLYISAQNNKSSGSVTVTIYSDGTSIKTASSSGAYVIATASR